MDRATSPSTEPYVVVRLMGPPRGKGRPRTRVVGSFATIYTDAKTRNFENELKAAGIAAMEGLQTLDEAVSVVVHAHMPIPESFSRKKREAALACEIMPTGKPDFDNVLKMLDGLNHHPPEFKGDRSKRPIIWRDDAQIVACQFLKRYSEHPRLEIAVWRWG